MKVSPTGFERNIVSDCSINSCDVCGSGSGAESGALADGRRTTAERSARGGVGVKPPQKPAACPESGERSALVELLPLLSRLTAEELEALRRAIGRRDE